MPKNKKDTVTGVTYQFEKNKITLKNNAICVIQQSEIIEGAGEIYTYTISIFKEDNVNTLLRRIKIDTPEEIKFTQNKCNKLYNLLIEDK